MERTVHYQFYVRLEFDGTYSTLSVLFQVVAEVQKSDFYVMLESLIRQHGVTLNTISFLNIFILQ